MFRVLALVLTVLAAPAMADGWRKVGLGGLDFEVPADWHFFHERDSQAGGFAPDARAFAAGEGAAVVVAPGPLAEQLPGASVLPGAAPELQGLSAVEVVTAAPLQPGLSARVFDIVTPDATPGLMLVAPSGQEAAYAAVFDHVLASMTAHPGPVVPVPDPSGTWYRNGDAALGLEVAAQDLGVAFDITAPGIAVELTRLDANTLQVMSDGALVTGIIDATGQMVRWQDGGVWLRQPAVLPAPAPDGAAGVSVPLDLGVIRAWVPALWPQERAVDAVGRPFVAATDPAGEAVARLVIIPGPSDATLWRGLADAVTAGLSGSDVKPEAPWTWARDASGIVSLPVGERPARLHLRAGPVSEGLAVLLVIWATDGNPATMDAAAMIALMSNLREAPPPVASPSEALGALPAFPTPPAAPPEAATAAAPDVVAPPPVADPSAPEILFDGADLTGWQVLGDFARVERGLWVDVPAGNGWAKSGLWSDRPLVGFGAQRGAVQVTLVLDPAATSDVLLTFDGAAGAEEWGVHDLRLHWTTRPEGGSHASLFHRQALLAEADLSQPVPERVSMHLDPAGVVRVDLPDGTTLESRVPPSPAAGWFLHVLSAARELDAPSRLGLRRIELAHGVPRALAPQPWPSDPRASVALIDGTMGRLWRPMALAGGDFRRDARLDAQGLRVEVAPGLGGATAGLFTPDPALWLDEFGPGAEAVVTFTLDPAGTDGFMLALAAAGTGGQGAEPPSPSLIFSFVPDRAAGAGRASVRLTPDVPDEAWASTGPMTAPGEVTLRIVPGAVTVTAKGFDPVTLPWSQAVEGTGLRLFLYPIAAGPDQGNRMALRQVTLRRTPGTPRSDGPAEDVAPLPVETLFDGTSLDGWEPVAHSGGDFAAFARLADGALRVDVPQGHYWGSTGLLSVAPVLVLDRRNAMAPAQIVLHLDPDPETTLTLALSYTRSADMWLDHVAWIALGRQPGGEDWMLTLHHSSGQQWSREISAAAMRNWDGRLIVEAGPGWAQARLPAGPVVRGEMPMVEGLPIHAVILGQAVTEGGPAHLALRRIQAGMATPPGLTAADRWILVDDQDFRPDDFLADIAAELEGAP